MRISLSIIFFCLILSVIHSEKKKIIYLIRHGETNFNTDPVPRVRGRINVPLNDEGIAHCRAAGEFLANEKIGKIYYSAVPRAKQSAECIVEKHKTKVEMVEEPLVIDISWGVYEGKTYQEAFGDEKGGDYMFHPEKLIIPEGETFYSVMSRLRLFFVRFWESDEEECTIVSHGAITNILSLMFLQAPLEKFWSMYMSACGVSKVQMKSIYSFTVEYWNANHFLKDAGKAPPTPFSFKDLMEIRHSARNFKSTPIPENTLREIISDSLLSPSWCNSQPWNIYVASGESLNNIRKMWMDKTGKQEKGYGDVSPGHRTDFSKRSQNSMQEFFKKGGMSEDKVKAFENAISDLFNAPTVVYLTLNKGHTVYSVYDLGGIGFAIMLAAKEHGVDSVPAYELIKYPDVLRKYINIPDDEEIVIGIALGYENEEHFMNKYRSPRLKVDDVCKFIN